MRVVSALAVFALFACGEQLRYEYQTGKDVEDAISRGWVPPCVPRSSKVQTEQNVDTNESWGIATFDDASGQSLRPLLVRWTIGKPQLREPAALSSWPRSMVETNSGVFYRCATGDPFLLSLDWQRNQMFFARGTL